MAATRARDLLVVPTLGDEPWDGGWFSPLNRALYPPPTDRRSATRGPKCPAFKSKDSVLERPNNEAAGASTVCPGQHAFPDAGGFPVVWWDPSALSLGAKPTFGVRRSELIVKDVPKHVVADGRSRYDRWQLARHDARARGATPSLRMETAHEWAIAGDGSRVVGAPADVQIVDLRQTDAGGRSGGVGFGLLVHGVLARAPFGAEPGMIADLAAAEGRALGLSDDDVRAAAAAVRRLLAHDLLVRASAADARGACRRETPVTYIEDAAAGAPIDGVVDLAFEEDGRWMVIDYKTDREIIASGEERYRRQVGLYATAIAQATGAPTSGILVRI